MTKNAINLNINELSIEERKRIENEFRSNLRYSWQKAMAFAVLYKPTIEKVMEELLETFQRFIPENHPLRGIIGNVISSSFHEVLGKLFSTNDIMDLEIENQFIVITSSKLEGILF